MLEHNIVEPSNSAWYSLVVLVCKPNNEYRFAVDYRKLNKVTKPQSFPLPRLEDLIDAIGETGANFTSADISKAYWQVAYDDAKEESALVFSNGIACPLVSVIHLQRSGVSCRRSYVAQMGGMLYEKNIFICLVVENKIEW